jgi:hypothetical protein
MCILLTSRPCFWVEKDLCSACSPAPTSAERKRKLDKFIVGALLCANRAIMQLKDQDSGDATVLLSELREARNKMIDARSKLDKARLILPEKSVAAQSRKKAWVQS